MPEGSIMYLFNLFPCKTVPLGCVCVGGGGGGYTTILG